MKNGKNLISLDTGSSNRKIQGMGVSEYMAIVREMKGQRVELELSRADLPLSFRSRSILPAESVFKVILEVDCHGLNFKPGDQVAVFLEERSRVGWSVFWTSLFPVLFFGAIYSVFHFLTKDVRVAVVGAAVLLFPYYSFLWLLRDNWSKEFIFRLK